MLLDWQNSYNTSVLVKKKLKLTFTFNKYLLRSRAVLWIIEINFFCFLSVLDAT